MKLVPLTQGKFAMVSDRDWPLVRQFKWSATNQGKKQECWYALTRQRTPEGKMKTFSMHRLILGFPIGLTDHRNGNGLDCRRLNLRLANSSQNRVNSRVRVDCRSKVTGVFKHQSGGWVAQCGVTYLGYFKTKAAAVRARRTAAKKQYGSFVRNIK